LQVGLGGWTSSNYAALACPDLPKCRRSGSRADYPGAFVLWRRLGINTPVAYWTTGACGHHFTHRLGAVLAASLLLLAAFSSLLRLGTGLRRAALAVLAPSRHKFT
jgi:cytochrome c oxidase assembly protein subunit 15